MNHRHTLQRQTTEHFETNRWNGRKAHAIAIGSVEVVYRGVQQKAPAEDICRRIVSAARKRGNAGVTFVPYGNPAEHASIAAGRFAVVADTAEEIEMYLHLYEHADATIICDETLCKDVDYGDEAGF